MTEIDWVSPLLPDRTDIANYTRRVAEALADSAHLNTIHNDQAGDPSAYRFGAMPPFFNIGNDVRFHGGIVQAAMSTTGAIIAHDHLVQNLLIGMLRAAFDDWATRYEVLMSMAYGRAGLEAAREFEAGNIDIMDVTKAFSGLEIVASKGLFVISHNPNLAATISDGTGLYCFTLPLPIAVPPERPDRVADASDTFEILLFGFIGENRSLSSLLDIIRDADDLKLRLTVAGTIGPVETQRAVEQAIAEGFNVRYTGFLEDDELDRLIHESDLVVNIRAPSMGEVSGSQLRIFANGGLSVVADDQWYAALPDEAVFKVDAPNATRDLRTIIEIVRNSPDKSRAMRAAGYQYVRTHHDLPCYQTAFEAMLDNCDEAIRHGIGLRLATHSAELFSRVGAGAYVNADRIIEQSRALSGWTV